MLTQRVGPVKEKMQSLEHEKRRAVRDREEAEVTSRAETDSLRATEQAIKDNNQAIMRCSTHTHTHTKTLHMCITGT